MEKVFCSQSPAETEDIAKQLSRELFGLIALRGNMGAGKTAFARGFVMGRYPSVRASSPTYTVMNAYADDLYHLDLYRLESADDFESIGFYDIPINATVLCEWPENLPDDVKPSAIVIIESSDEENKRIIKVVQ